MSRRKYCPSCGANLDSEGKYCSACGDLITDLPSGEKEETPAFQPSGVRIRYCRYCGVRLCKGAACTCDEAVAWTKKEEARKKAEEEAARKKAEEEAARKKAEEEAARKKAEEEAARKKAEEEEEARKKAEEEEEARKKAEEEEAARKKAEEEEAARRKAEEEAVAGEKAAEEATAHEKSEEEEAARRKAEEEAAAREKAEEEAARKKAEEEAAKQKTEPEPVLVERKPESLYEKKKKMNEARDRQTREDLVKAVKASEKKRKARRRRWFLVLIVAAGLIFFLWDSQTKNEGNSGTVNTSSIDEHLNQFGEQADAGNQEADEQPADEQAAAEQAAEEQAGEEQAADQVTPEEQQKQADNANEDYEAFEAASVDLSGYHAIAMDAKAETRSGAKGNASYNSYPPSNMVDGEVGTVWEEAAEGLGTDMIDITLTAKEAGNVRYIAFKLGRWVSDKPEDKEKYLVNSRPRTLTVRINDGEPKVAHFEDEKKEWIIDLGTPVDLSTIVLTLGEGYKGSQYNDVAITEITAYAEN